MCSQKCLANSSHKYSISREVVLCFTNKNVLTAAAKHVEEKRQPVLLFFFQRFIIAVDYSQK